MILRACFGSFAVIVPILRKWPAMCLGLLSATSMVAVGLQNRQRAERPNAELKRLLDTAPEGAKRRGGTRSGGGPPAYSPTAPTGGAADRAWAPSPPAR